ncbi:MAG: fold metallo-hydrolase [Rhizobacter sp.]|nr:fold metallo-hydrolase [Rhizobacter sp.]
MTIRTENWRGWIASVGMALAACTTSMAQVPPSAVVHIELPPQSTLAIAGHPSGGDTAVAADAGASAASNAASSTSTEPAAPTTRTTPTTLAEGSIYFVGTATVIIRYAGLTILTDPNFLHRGDHVHLGYGLTSTRVTEPALSLSQLPPIDLVVLSHFHGDHFDQLVQRQLNKAMPIVSTPSAVHALRKLGFTQTVALERWQSLEVSRGASKLRITATPARHGPALVAKALPPVMGSMLEFESPSGQAAYRLYISGDTTIFDDLKDIPKRYPDVDMALLHLGGTSIGGVIVTMDAKQGIEALHIIDPKHAIPIHYNDYTVFKSPLSDFVQAVRQAGLQDKVTYLTQGDVYKFKVAAEKQR